MEVQHFFSLRTEKAVARKFSMTYVSNQKRWTKDYRGRIYSVSCKQLGCAPGKEASAPAMESWWDKKRAEVDAQAAQEEEAKGTPHPRSEAIVTAMEAQGLLSVTDTSQDASQKFRELFAQATARGEHLPDWLTEAVLGPAKVQRIKEGIAALMGEPLPADKTVGGNVTKWLDMLKLSVKQRMIDVGRYDSYRRNIKLFENWLLADSDINVITSPKFAEWWAYLSLKVGENEYSTAYAKGIFMTSKQFIAWAGEMNVIQLPNNLRSKRFKFADAPKNISVLAIEEVKTLLAAATGWSDKTKLYLLLMLNCGMYQADIADIGENEVDWKAGTITRFRSKMKHKKDAITVTYKIWPETFDLLVKFRSKLNCPNEQGNNRVLTTDEGKPLVRLWLENDKLRRYDVIQTAFTRLFERVGWKKALKELRKTSASELGSHREYALYVQHFLAQSPRGVTDRSYVKPSQEKFDEALAWLRSRYL
jgi:integrase